ncbi:NosD domain-containing protein [Methanotrichaceae archaeon M04Ac]|uniref:NosD domain-containing protein n=1 Tax=Candidatus Methanocrinis alkalitolerans TaxID=3033395 RepID=A0ABT5XDZ3_9EURY|nr:NosD domain-containing protein [Candidatus Methanocrinis alkalitolerans]MCR3882778.1 right-handed parallel beta-helix repeat-containing protein [Methanothrix sp.]MDF0592929.1 NosD domain-containing protein [Candidatus Methanocrinis alkalitolerans]
MEQIRAVARFSLLLSILALAGSASAGPIFATGDLQAAIDGAMPGDTLIVPSGEYDPFTVDKRLSIQGVGFPSARAQTQNSAITIMADGVRLQGFKVVGAPKNQDDKFRFYMDLSDRKPQYSLNQPNSGVLVVGDGVFIEDLVVEGSEAGVLVKGSRNFTIINSSFERCDSGLWLQDCEVAAVEGSAFLECDKYGVRIEGSEGITVQGNRVCENSGAGVLLKDSSGCTVAKNEFSRNWQGLFLWNSSFCDILENDAHRNVYYGMVIASGSNNTIVGNRVTKNGGSGPGLLGIGISIQENCTHNLVAGNLLEENLNGIDLTRGSQFNLVCYNEISKNSNGIRLDKNENNLVYKNNFRRNIISGYDNASNNFWNGSIGNYYDDYRGRDRDSDGIGDDPYWIPKGSSCAVDWRPLMKPVEEEVDVDAAWEDLGRYAIYSPLEDLPYKVENRTIVIAKREPSKWWI